MTGTRTKAPANLNKCVPPVRQLLGALHPLKVPAFKPTLNHCISYYDKS